LVWFIVNLQYLFFDAGHVLVFLLDGEFFKSTSDLAQASTFKETGGIIVNYFQYLYNFFYQGRNLKGAPRKFGMKLLCSF